MADKKTIVVDGKNLLVGRFEVRGGRGGPKIVCPKCGKVAPVGDFYLRDKGTRLYAHKPCEIARQKPRSAKRAAAKTAAKKAAAKPTAKPAPRRTRTAKKAEASAE